MLTFTTEEYYDLFLKQEYIYNGLLATCREEIHHHLQGKDAASHTSNDAFLASMPYSQAVIYSILNCKKKCSKEEFESLYKALRETFSFLPENYATDLTLLKKAFLYISTLFCSKDDALECVDFANKDRLTKNSTLRHSLFEEWNYRINEKEQDDYDDTPIFPDNFEEDLTSLFSEASPSQLSRLYQFADIPHRLNSDEQIFLLFYLDMNSLGKTIVKEILQEELSCLEDGEKQKKLCEESFKRFICPCDSEITCSDLIKHIMDLTTSHKLSINLLYTLRDIDEDAWQALFAYQTIIALDKDTTQVNTSEVTNADYFFLFLALLSHSKSVRNNKSLFSSYASMLQKEGYGDPQPTL